MYLVLFSVTYFLYGSKLQTLFFEFEIKKNCHWWCQGPSNRPRQHIEPHPTSWQHPLINYSIPTASTASAGPATSQSDKHNQVSWVTEFLKWWENHIFSTIFEFFFCLVLFFMILKKLSTFKFFLKIATFFKISQTLKNKHVRSLIHLSLVAQLISFFYLKKWQSFIGLWNQLKENFGNSNFTLCNQKDTSI